MLKENLFYQITEMKSGRNIIKQISGIENMRKIEKYKINKEKLKQIKISNLTDYNIQKMLYADLWHMEELSNTQKIARVLLQIICKTLHISKFEDDFNSINMAVEIQYPGNIFRKDNQAIFCNLYNYLKPARHILIKKQYIFDLKKIGHRIVDLCKYFQQMQGFQFCNKLFLAAQLVMVSNFIDDIRKFFRFGQCRFMLIFQEHDTISNVIIQTAKQYGVQVISPQHSMPMNRHEDSDQLFFDCFSCDYKLLWNEASKKQFLSAGINEKHLVVVGNTKKMHIPNKKTEEKKMTNNFGIVLDGPMIDGATGNNRELVNIALKLSDEFGLGCIIKLHPFDEKERYLYKIRNVFAKAIILDTEAVMEQYEQMVDFSLGHTTGAMLDLIYDGCFLFQYKTDVKFPIETEDIYWFQDYEELRSKYIKWKENYEYYSKNYGDVVKRYHVENPVELHNEFFNKLICK